MAKLEPAEPLAVAVEPAPVPLLEVISTLNTEFSDAVTDASDPIPLTVTLLSLSRVAPAAAAP